MEEKEEEEDEHRKNRMKRTKEERGEELSPEEEEKLNDSHHHNKRQQQPSKPVILDLCSISVGAGSLSPINGTLQPYDSSGSGDHDDNEVGDGDDVHNDDVLQHVKDLRVIQIEL